MKILKFTISGESAFFRCNEVNDGDITYSYGQLHKPALLGILGAIVGLGGHTEANYTSKGNYIHPEFYNILKDIKVSICPNSSDGYFQRKKQNMTNTCGYSKSEKKGQTLMYTEQWLYKPSWDVYIDLDSVSNDIEDKLVDFILNSKCMYIPYLGKTNHPAIISNMSLCDGDFVKNTNKIKIDSLILKTESINIKNSFIDDDEDTFEYREILPFKYSDDNCLYCTNLFVFTNKYCNAVNDSVILVQNKHLIFS